MRLHNTVHRACYEQKLANYRDSRDIKVITGVRRCGKSTLLKLLVDQISTDIAAPDNIFYRKMDGFGVPLNPDAAWLESELLVALEAADSGKPLYVFIDEVQEVQGWEKVVRRLHTHPNVDTYITGSNAHVLSSDLATLLGGRYVEIPVQPLSFDEYLQFWRAFDGALDGVASGAVREGLDARFAAYLKYGGMPGQFELPERTEEYLTRFLESIRDTVILNDVAKRVQVGDMDLLTKLVRYVFSTSGCLFSTRGVVNALASAGRKTSAETVDNYLKALEDAYVLQGCEQVGVAGKQVLRPQRKFYPIDTGLRNLATGFAPKDFGAQLECVVFNELVRRGYQVSVGTLLKGEIDFVAARAGEKLYIQVTETMADPKTYERELAPFALVRDSFPKLVLTTDRMRLGVTEQGVRIENIIDWLLGAWS